MLSKTKCVLLVIFRNIVSQMAYSTVQNNPPGLYILVRTASDGVFITSSSFFRPTLPSPISETKED